MSSVVAFALVAIPLAWHFGVVTLTYLDAREEGMPVRKWTLIAFLIPIFGFFAYLMERSEQYYDPESDPFREGTYEVHESRTDDLRPIRGGPPSDDARTDGAEAGGRSSADAGGRSSVDAGGRSVDSDER